MLPPATAPARAAATRRRRPSSRANRRLKLDHLGRNLDPAGFGACACSLATGRRRYHDAGRPQGVCCRVQRLGTVGQITMRSISSTVTVSAVRS